jgi:pyruvyl transferase EpsO
MDKANELIIIIKNLLGDSKSVALAMFPYHMNVGDSAIWGGTKATLDLLQVKIRYACSHVTYNPTHLKKCHPDGPILILGGGNFGDAYPLEAGLRNRILDDFTDRKIIQLPQSIWFKTEDGKDSLVHRIEKHPNFTLLVRDKISLDIAEKLFSKKTILCPDMAFALANKNELYQISSSKEKFDILCMMRQDGEKADRCEDSLLEYHSKYTIIEEDWKCDSKKYRETWASKDQLKWYCANLIVKSATKKHGAQIPMGIVCRAKHALADLRTKMGIKQIQSGGIIITDRLHVGILSWISGKKSILIDNCYGKNKRVYDTWFLGDTDIMYANSKREAFEIACKYLIK